MDEYKKPYLTLFNGVTDALAALGRGEIALAQALLMKAQAAAEAAFIEETE